jgi:hypothetical protein
MNSSVKFESDFVPFKMATDVVLNGNAWTPKRQRVTNLTVSLSVGKYRKDLLIIGDRKCRYKANADPVFTDPEPFETMEIRYERAYGGVDIYSDPKMQCPYLRNHLGRGFAIANTAESVGNLDLPNIEDPGDRLTPARLCAGHIKDWERQPMPQGFGWVTKGWRQRSRYAGVMPADRNLEQQLRTVYANAIPPAQQKLYEQTELPDMDFRFFSGASPDLALPYLSGNEEINLFNLDPEGAVQFRLPGEQPRMSLDIGNGVQESAVVLQTVMIRMEDRQIDMVWRSAFPYPGPDWFPQMKKMEVQII